MSDVRVDAVSVSYGETQAVRDVSFELDSGRRLAILGPSGCGKSSLLRVVAGLEPLASGRVVVAGRDQANIPTFRRGMGLMFQDHALFPHLDVSGNVAFGLRMAKLPSAEIRTRVLEMLELVGLSAYAHSQVGDLSGGEQQRVALARTLAPRPKVVLLDEPLGSLDRVMREDLMATMTEVFDATGSTVVFVTHDQSEAFALGHEVAVMRSGRIQQMGAAQELWTRPVDGWVAHFLGLSNIFAAHTRIFGGRLSREHEFLLRPDLLRIDGAAGGGTEGLVRGGNGDLVAPGVAGSQAGVGAGAVPGRLDAIPGTVVGASFRGGYSAVKVAMTNSYLEAGPPVTSTGGLPGPRSGSSANGRGETVELEVWVLGDPPEIGQRVVVSAPAAAVLELGAD